MRFETAGPDGHVDPGGLGVEWVRPTVTVRKFSVSDMDNNIYVVFSNETRAGFLIDPADDAEHIRRAIGDVDVFACLVTHGHWDHVRAWQDLRAEPRVPMWAHPGDTAAWPSPPDRRLSHGDELTAMDVTVEVRHTPGHTPGSICLVLRDGPFTHLFSGDTLFPGGPGATHSPEDFETIMRSLRTRIFEDLPDDTHVHPGHGDDTTLGAERNKLDNWEARGW